ncbi:alpha-amylase family protein [Pelagibacterium lacus]|uniref:Alpha-amylase n=1 Tax=Pelagibacterium lacus TaxID=2282655 RepID=A0A369WAQ8_9HYPH|nr:alpha-amylase family protein [Pelagibacterium lacus]RDE10480.1 alpha-amylase [Pelagibacterium lacus]
MAHWWKDAVFYAVDVGRFHDGNGDGIGDFPGLRQKLPYLCDLGVTCIWLQPFYPSTHRDNGYDVTDYFSVDPSLGSFDDLIATIRAAGELGMRVITDLVVQHTSDAHPWFRSARHDEQSPFRDYYIWADHPPPTPPGRGPMFPGAEKAVWTHCEIAGAYYHHRFYHFQPGLNHQNPAVRDEIERIIDFWCSFGISGFRIDAASHLIERPLDRHKEVDETHATLRHIYAHTTGRKPDTVLMGEVDEEPGELASYFDGEQLNMMFNFYLDNYLLLALAREDGRPVHHALSALPQPPANGQWANFLRNHDEADLERLEAGEMADVLDAFAPEETMRIYDRGIRRRLAPMLGGDRDRLKMAYSLLFSMPGCPVITYGEELGMGDDLDLPERESVRLPMQWTAGRNGGFSEAPISKLPLKPVAGGAFGYRAVNARAAEKDEKSLLNHIRKLSALRLRFPEIGAERLEFFDTGHDAVLAHRFGASQSGIMMIHNLSGKTAAIDLALDTARYGHPDVVLGEGRFDLAEGRLAMELEPYGLRWIAAG